MRQQKPPQDHERTIISIELAAERKAGKEKSKLISDLQADNDKLLARTVELEDDMDKLTKKIDKLDKQIQEQDKTIERSKKDATNNTSLNIKIQDL